MSHSHIQHIPSVLNAQRKKQQHLLMYRVQSQSHDFHKAKQHLYITEAESKTNKQKQKKQPFNHLTSHPLQNYPPQPQGRGCWSEGGEQKSSC